MIKRFSLLVGLLASLLTISCKKESIDEKALREAIEFTQKQCPKRMDECTIMDSTTYDIRERTFTYHYSVCNALDAEEVYSEELVEAFREIILEQIRSSISLKTYKDAGITLRYRYVSQTSGQQYLELVFTEEDYK